MDREQEFAVKDDSAGFVRGTGTFYIENGVTLTINPDGPAYAQDSRALMQWPTGTDPVAALLIEIRDELKQINKRLAQADHVRRGVR